MGKDRTQLDLAPDTPDPPFDEIGTSFVGRKGGTPIFPSHFCDIGAPAQDGLEDASGVPSFADVSFQ